MKRLITCIVFVALPACAPLAPSVPKNDTNHPDCKAATDIESTVMSVRIGDSEYTVDSKLNVSYSFQESGDLRMRTYDPTKLQGCPSYRITFKLDTSTNEYKVIADPYKQNN